MSLSTFLTPHEVGGYLDTYYGDDVSRIFSPFNIPAIEGWYIPKKIFDAGKDRGDLSVLGCESPLGTKVVIKAVSTLNVDKHLELIQEA